MRPLQKRAEIKRLLSLLEDHHRDIFNRMYSPTDVHQDVEETVDKIEAKKLDWALTQCQNSYYKLFKVIKSA